MLKVGYISLSFTTHETFNSAYLYAAVSAFPFASAAVTFPYHCGLTLQAAKHHTAIHSHTPAPVKWAWKLGRFLNRYPPHFVFLSPGYAKRKACPTDPAEDCMRCGPEQYLNEESQKPHCDACVSCTKGSWFTFYHTYFTIRAPLNIVFISILLI